MRTYGCLLVFGTAMLVSPSGVLGQEVGPGTVAPDDPGLYIGFFSLHEAIQKDISAEKDTEKAANFRRAAAQSFNISEADFAIVGKIADSVLEKLNAVSQDAKAYIQNEVGAGRTPDRATLVAFEQHRIAVLRAGANDLQKLLSPAGWNALHTYINNTYRSRVIRKEMRNAK